MIYEKTREGIFLSRPNRFIAQVMLDGKEETVHVKNTGRCAELLLPGRRVVLAQGENSNRKTRYDLIAVDKPGLGWVNLDSQAPNRVVLEWLKRNPEITLCRPEYPFGASRMDFYLEIQERRILMEVKGCTLEIDGMGYFPDAPTERGVKHLYALMEAKRQGMEAWLAFVIAMSGIRQVLPNVQTHPQFGQALEEAKAAGVQIMYFPCRVTENSLEITDCIIDSPQDVTRGRFSCHKMR